MSINDEFLIFTLSSTILIRSVFIFRITTCHHPCRTLGADSMKLQRLLDSLHFCLSSKLTAPINQFDLPEDDIDLLSLLSCLSINSSPFAQNSHDAIPLLWILPWKNLRKFILDRRGRATDIKKAAFELVVGVHVVVDPECRKVRWTDLMILTSVGGAYLVTRLESTCSSMALMATSSLGWINRTLLRFLTHWVRDSCLADILSYWLVDNG